MGDTAIPAAPVEEQPDHRPQEPAIDVSGHAQISNDTDMAPNPDPSHLGASPLQQSQQQPAPVQHAFSSQLNMSSTSLGDRSGPYNMAQMATALPQMNYRPGHYPQGTQQRFHPAPSPSVMHQMHQMPQFSGSSSMNIPGQNYYIPQHQQPQQQQHQQHMSHYYGPGQPASSHAQAGGVSRPNMAYYPNQMVNHSHHGYYYPQATQYPTLAQHIPTTTTGHYVMGSPTSPAHHPNPNPDAAGIPSQFRKPTHDGSLDRQGSVRGPPRKPRQSGHAIWIGNLPPQADLMSLVHHVCKEAPGLQSLFLISKSNCAFANFKDELDCVAAQQKLHDSKFQTVRLVSRLRKSTVEGASGVTAPTGPAAASPAPPLSPVDDQIQDVVSPVEADQGLPVEASSTQSNPATPVDGAARKDRFFILKSLTVEDLDLSNTDNVYLVFSANKSGEYFGYARMVSEVNEDPEAAIEFAPKAQAASDLNLPKAIATDATEHAPKGRIIDDSARGTIFWEADRDDSESGSDAGSETGSIHTEEEPQTWGKPFKLQWLSTTRLPFYRTRGLRNPWNSNREVKIARDGTELEPSAGRRLIGLFNRIQSPTSSHPGIRPPPSAGIAPGYPQLRPYGR